MPSANPCHQHKIKYTVICILYHAFGYKDDTIWAALLYGFFEEEEFDFQA
jgi:hypothetical protein